MTPTTAVPLGLPPGGPALRGGPPPIATPQAARPPRLPRQPAAGGTLADTSADLGDLLAPVTAPVGFSGSRQPANVSHDADDDDSPSVEIPLSIGRDMMAVLWPLMVFVVAPLTLLGALALLWLLVRAAIQY